MADVAPDVELRVLAPGESMPLVTALKSDEPLYAFRSAPSPSRIPSTSARSRSRTASSWRRWPASATGSSAFRPSATAPGLAVSEMVSSYALHYRNERTMRELLRIHPDEHPVSVQLFGPDPEAMRSAASLVAEAGADLLDINMGCPVRKVLKTGAGAALLDDHDLALEVARAAAEGSGLPVTVKLRSGLRPGDRSGYELALRLAEEAGVAAIGFHPRPATVHHKGRPDYALAAELVAELRRREPRLPCDHLGWPRRRREGAPRLRSLERRRGDGRSRRHGQPLDLRGADRAARGDARGLDEVVRSFAGYSTAPPSTGGRSARRATCASSIRGISSASTSTDRRRRRVSADDPPR